MEQYSPHELVLIGFGKRLGSVQPEKNSVSWKREEQVLYHLFFFGRTERPDRTGIISTSFDVDGHYLRWTRTPICAQPRGGVVACPKKYTVRTDSAGEAQDSAWTQPRFCTQERSE